MFYYNKIINIRYYIFFQDLKGVDNIFAQHVPLMKELVEDLIKSKLKEEQYPFLSDINQPTKK